MYNIEYDLVILDFHGVLTDHQLRLVKAHHVAGHTALGVHLKKELYQKALTRPSHDNGDGQSNKDFIAEHFGDLGEDAVRRYTKAFTSTMKAIYIPTPGIARVTNRLRELSVNTVLLTNGSNPPVIQDVLRTWDPTDRFGIGALASKLYSSHVSGVEKPNEEAVNFILRDLARQGIVIDKTRALMVGDYKNDILTAHNSGIHSVLLLRGSGAEGFPICNPRPTYIIHEILELIDIVTGRREPETRKILDIPPAFWKKEALMV